MTPEEVQAMQIKRAEVLREGIVMGSKAGLAVLGAVVIAIIWLWKK